MTFPLFLIPMVAFTAGTTFVTWLGCYGYDKPNWYILPAGLLTVIYEAIIGIIFPVTFAQFYALIPMVVSLLWVASLKIRQTFV